MNVLQIAPDGTRERRAIPDEWARGYRVPVYAPMNVNWHGDPSKSNVATLEYRNTGCDTDGLTVFLTKAHHLDVAFVEMSFPTREPRASAETHLRNDMISFIEKSGIDRKDVFAERISDIPNPNDAPSTLLYSLRMEWVTLKPVS